MQEVGEAAKKLADIFSKCSLRLENEVISHEYLLRTYTDFLDKNMFCEHHKTIAVLSAENRVFDAVTIACAALSCILTDNINPESIVSQLDIDARVEYKKSRYIFKGFSEQYGPNYVVLVKDNGEQKTVGKSNWSKIVPYYGKAESLDGKGIKKTISLRARFFTDVLGVPATEIPSIIRTSVIMIMTPEDARYYLDSISFSFGGHSVSLLDLVTASYFTENNAIRFRGNSSDNDPVLKITNKAANALSLIYGNSENDNIGVLVLGQEVYRKNYTELPNLISRRKLKYSLVSMKADDAYGHDVVNQYEEAELFVCTRDFLLSTPLDMVEENRFTIHLHKALDHIVDHEIIKVTAESDFAAADYYDFKSLMSVICRQAKDNRNDKDNLFIRQAYSLMKLMVTAPFFDAAAR